MAGHSAGRESRARAFGRGGTSGAEGSLETNAEVITMNDKIQTQDLFQTLAHEHALILRVLDAFERYISNVEAGAQIDSLELGRFVTFFREYVDLTHHEREECILFPALVKHGFADKYGPLAHVRDQHGKEREFLWLLMRAFAMGRLSSPEVGRILTKVAMDYVTFQRAHIQKEIALLYPVARQELTPADLLHLSEDSAQFDRGSHRANPAWLTELGESLASPRTP